MTRQEMLALSLRELDAMVAEKVMGNYVEGERELENETYYERFGSGSHQRIWGRLCWYSSDDNAVRLVRNRIAELGLIRPFVDWMQFDGCLDVETDGPGEGVGR